jgi:hypothetical protein
VIHVLKVARDSSFRQCFFQKKNRAERNKNQRFLLKGKGVRVKGYGLGDIRGDSMKGGRKGGKERD